MQQNNTPAKPQNETIIPTQAWIKTEDNPPATPKDCSFASNSRSPSPENSSFESTNKAGSSSPTSPNQFPASALNPEGNPLLTHLYNPLLLHSAGFPFYKLSPLLAQNPFLPHPLLMSLNHRSHLELMQEHQELLSRFSAATTPERESPPSSSSAGDDISERSSSPGPMDLSLKITSSLLAAPRFPAAPRLPELAERFRRECLPPLQPCLPFLQAWNPALQTDRCLPSLRDSDPSEEGNDGKSDNNRNNLHATNFEENRDALDLSVNSWSAPFPYFFPLPPPLLKSIVIVF